MSSPTPDEISRALGASPVSGSQIKAPREEVRPFAPYMQQGETNPLLTAGKTPQISPFDLAQGRVPAAGPNFVTIQHQAKAAQSLFGDISNQLNTPNLKLKQSTKYLLRNKLTSAKGHILSANNKLGAPKIEEEELPPGSNPLQKFLSLVTNGQRQLEQTQQQVAALAAKGTDMKPVDFLLVQIKLSKAQQELEYSSLLLGKATDDFKMMMNIQL